MSVAVDLESRRGASIHPQTAIGTVRLTASDVQRSRTFYEQAIGLRPFDRGDGTIALGPDLDHPLVELRGESSAPQPGRHVTGLYHLAILVPTRLDLALSLARLAQARWSLDGASDHLVSEALYLSDPDGNGIEIYRDRPREQWPRAGDRLEMATLPLDLQDVMNELATTDTFQQHMPPGTTIGHVHLKVADLGQAEAFYSGVLGLDVTVRGYPGALFVSAGGYHHHIGLNTWQSAGAAPPPPGSIGLRTFELTLPNQRELELVLERITAAGIATEPACVGAGAIVRDPSGNAVMLRAAHS